MSKKQYDDTELEYYGLTEEDLEKIKNEKTYTLEEVENSLKMQWMIEDMFWVKITDTDVLLDLYNNDFKNNGLGANVVKSFYYFFSFHFTSCYSK